MGPPQPASTCVLYKCDLIVVCREQAVLCDDLYFTVIHILMWGSLSRLNSHVPIATRKDPRVSPLVGEYIFDEELVHDMDEPPWKVKPARWMPT